MNQDFFVTDSGWAVKYPGAKAGILVIENVENETSNKKLDERKVEVEEKLRKQFHGFSREDFNTVPTIDSYNKYYKNFGKTYHVRSQVESMVNGKSLSSASTVLTAMFMAEVNNMLLTAGHDLDLLDLPVKIKIAAGDESFVDIRGATKTCVAGDMIMLDGGGVISSIILGPDSRTKITSATKNVLFAVYAPADITEETMRTHLEDMENSIKIFSPNSETKLIKVFEAR